MRLSYWTKNPTTTGKPDIFRRTMLIALEQQIITRLQALATSVGGLTFTRALVSIAPVPFSAAQCATRQNDPARGSSTSSGRNSLELTG